MISNVREASLPHVRVEELSQQGPSSADAREERIVLLPLFLGEEIPPDVGCPVASIPDVRQHLGLLLVGEIKHRGKAVGSVQSGWAIGWCRTVLAVLPLFIRHP
jgi:hypothetical protein